MAGEGTLTLDLLDVRGDRLKDRVDVKLKHTVLSNVQQFTGIDATKRLHITNLDTSGNGLYSLQVLPYRHLPVGKFIRILEGKIVQQSIVFPVNPDRVTNVEFPLYESLEGDIKAVLQASSVEGHEGKRGAELYNALDDVRKAGLLNIYAKMKATWLPSGRDTFSYVTSFTRLFGDRFFARVQTELRDEVKESTHTHLFHEVSAMLHIPPPSFDRYDSFKTPELYGNLQLTFFRNPTTEEFIAEGGIDAADGIMHIFQILQGPSLEPNVHPYNIHEILLEFQKIDPGYKIIA